MYLSAAANEKSFIYSPTITRKKPIEYSLDRTPALSAEKKTEPAADGNSFYTELGRLAKVSEEDIARQRAEFDDMYVTSAVHKYFSANQSKITSGKELLTLRVKIAGIASREGRMFVPIEAGELPQFMDKIRNSLNDGMSLEDILKQKYDEHIRKYGEEGHCNSFADWFAINTSTGEVMSADPISRTYHGNAFDEEVSDVEAVMELADDLATFLRYAVFSREEDDPERVRQLISFIKNKQAYANYDRYICGEDGDLNSNSNDILSALIDAGVLKAEDDEDEANQADELMEALRLHMEEIKTLRSERDRIVFAKEEIEELLAERNEIASGAVTAYTPVKSAKPPLRIPSFENRVNEDLIYNGEDYDDLLERLIEAWTTTEDDEKKKIKNRRPRGADDAFMNMLLMRNEMMQGIKKARNTVLKIEQDQFDDIFKHMEDNTNPETTEIKIETETTTAAQTETEAENEENIEEQAS